MELLASILTPLVTAIAGWMIGKRKQDNEFLDAQLASINALTKSYHSTIERFTGSLERFVEVSQENANLKGEMKTLRGEISSLKGENTKLRNRVKALERLIKEMGVDLDYEDVKEEQAERTEGDV